MDEKNKLFKEGTNEAAFLKLGFYGGNGSGKTYTSALVAIGLHKMIKSKKPVFFLDSETGSDYVLPLFKKAGVDIQVAKSRAFSDLLDAVDIAEKEGSILIIDSVTHYWDELVEAYKKKKNLIRLFVQHWMELKPTWRVFSAKFVNSKVHIIMCGRLGDVWEDIEDDDGVKELKKVGTRMRTEKDLGYEPSLLVEMEKAIMKKGWTHKAFVEKDRFDIMNFQVFSNPVFEDFLPHINSLSLGGVHKAFDADRNSQDMFEKKNTGADWYKKKEQTLEKIQNEINLLHPGRGDEQKNNRNLFIKEIFGTHAWSEIKEMALDTLMNGLTDIEKKNIEKAEKLSKSDRVEKKEKKEKK